MIEETEKDTIQGIITRSTQTVDQFFDIPQGILDRIKIVNPRNGDPIFSKGRAGVRVESSEDGQIIAVIEFDPNSFFLIRDRQKKEEKMTGALIEERIHAYHLLINPSLSQRFLKFLNRSMELQRETTLHGPERSGTASLIELDLNMINKIKEVAKYFGIEVREDNELEYYGYTTVLTSSDLGITALRILAEKLCEKFGIDKNQIPPERNDERSTAIYIASFINSIINSDTYFKSHGELIEFCRDLGLKPLISEAFKSELLRNVKNIDLSSFLSLLRQYITDTNSIQILECLTEMVSYLPNTLEVFELRATIKEGMDFKNVEKLRKVLYKIIELLGSETLDPRLTPYIIKSVIENIIKGSSSLTYMQGLSLAVSILEYGDLPFEESLRTVFLQNKEYIQSLINLVIENPEGVTSTGHNLISQASNPKFISEIDLKPNGSSLSCRVNDSAISTIISDSWGDIYSAVIAYNSSVLRGNPNSSEDLLTKIDLIKEKHAIDFLVEPIAKVIGEWIKNKSINIDLVINYLSWYVNIEIVSEELLRKLVTAIASLVSRNNIQDIKNFLRLDTLDKQLSFLGINSEM